MHLPNIVILTHYSLLAIGLASKLDEYRELMAVRTLDLDQKDYLSVLKKENPEVVILEASEADPSQQATIMQVLDAAPDAKVISLDLTSDSVKVFSSTERKLNGANDLVGLIQTFSGVNK
jgi:DNA-binding NarL/FixJ family response regulator